MQQLNSKRRAMHCTVDSLHCTKSFFPISSVKLRTFIVTMYAFLSQTTSWDRLGEIRSGTQLVPSELLVTEQLYSNHSKKIRDLWPGVHAWESSTTTVQSLMPCPPPPPTPRWTHPCRKRRLQSKLRLQKKGKQEKRQQRKKWPKQRNSQRRKRKQLRRRKSKSKDKRVIKRTNAWLKGRTNAWLVWSAGHSTAPMYSIAVFNCRRTVLYNTITNRNGGSRIRIALLLCQLSSHAPTSFYYLYLCHKSFFSFIIL